MSEYAEKVRRYYDLGLWSEERVRKAVEKEAITPEEYEAITGKGLLGD